VSGPRREGGDDTLKYSSNCSFVLPAFVGAGDKLGTITFVACIITIGLTELHETVRRCE
jgi:hypothetical protein